MIDTQSFFPESRYRHCHNVGLKMYDYAKRNLNWTEEKCQEMFVLGCLHDIGYELNGDAFLHDVVMGETMRESNYKYVDEIINHSFMQTKFDTPEMRLLYFGDMTVDGNGNWCTLDERMKDLEERHGKDSKVYKESKLIADALLEWGFDDVLPEVEWGFDQAPLETQVFRLSERPSTIAKDTAKTEQQLETELEKEQNTDDFDIEC